MNAQDLRPLCCTIVHSEPLNCRHDCDLVMINILGLGARLPKQKVNKHNTKCLLCTLILHASLTNNFGDLTLFFYCFTGTPKCKAHIVLKTCSSWDRNDLIYTKNNIKLTKKPMKQNLWLALIEMKHHKWKQRKFFFNSPIINWIFKHESTKPIPYSLTHTPFLQNTCSLEIPVQHY